MVAIWAGAGFIGGVMAGTKKGAFVVGLMAWLSCWVLFGMFGYLMIQGGLALGSFVIPPGSSFIDILGIPVFQDLIDQVMPLVSGILGGGGISLDPMSLLMLISPLLLWIFTPLIVVVIAGIVGAIVRRKEEF